MPSMVRPGPVQEDACIREAVCISTRRVIDSCKSRDCAEDLPMLLTPAGWEAVADAAVVRGRGAELLFVRSDVEEVTFNRGYYSVDLTYYYRVNGDAVSALGRAVPFAGLAVFSRRVILRGGGVGAKIFSSDTVLGGEDASVLADANLPRAVVEAVDPIQLGMRLAEGGEELSLPAEIPPAIAASFDGELTPSPDSRHVLATLGQFSIVRMERDTQLLIPAYDYWVPDRACAASGDDDPCSLFDAIGFPTEEFFPPETVQDASEPT